MELTDVQDRRLAEQAAAGDDAAFAELVGRHREALVRFVARRTGRATIAEDAVQDALLSALRTWRGGESPRDVKAWLHTVAWRRAVDLLRREAPGAPAVAWQDVRVVEGIDVAVADAWELDRMMGHWAELPHRQRHALAMRVLEGRSLEEIGRELGVSADAAKSLVARSRRSLAVAVAAGEPRGARRVRGRRHVLLLPPALVERLREAATFATHHEQPMSLVTKACAGACAAVLAGGATTSYVAVAPVEPLVRPAVQRAIEEKPERKPPAKRARSAPVPAPTPSATAQPAPAPAATRPQTAQAVARPETGRARGRRPSPLPTAAGGGSTASPEPTPQPTPDPTPAPTASPGPAADPAS